jgi:hypothetical protein
LYSANVEKAIVRAGTDLGWMMTKKSDKHIVGKLALFMSLKSASFNIIMYFYYS